MSENEDEISEILAAEIDPSFFLGCTSFVHEHQPQDSEEDGFPEIIFLLKQFFDQSDEQFERPWEVMYAIHTRVCALISLVEGSPISGLSLKEVNSGIFLIREDLIKAAAVAPLYKSMDGEWKFDKSKVEQIIASASPPPPYDWDPEKARHNFNKHGVAFSTVTLFDWAGAIEAEDTRYDYGEVRMQALGKIGDRYHVLVYAIRADMIRVISLRKANKRETP